MMSFFALVGLWLIGWGILLSALRLRASLMRASPTSAVPSAPTSPRHRGHALTLFDTPEIAP